MSPVTHQPVGSYKNETEICWDDLSIFVYNRENNIVWCKYIKMAFNAIALLRVSKLP